MTENHEASDNEYRKMEDSCICIIPADEKCDNVVKVNKYTNNPTKKPNKKCRDEHLSMYLHPVK